MLEAILENLINVGIALAIYAGSWIANTAVKLYYNIQILDQPFDGNKFKVSLLKVLSFLVSMTLQVTCITAIPLFVNEVGFAIPDTYIDVFNILIIIQVIITVAIQYLAEAFTALKDILGYNNISEKQQMVLIHNETEPSALINIEDFDTGREEAVERG